MAFKLSQTLPIYSNKPNINSTHLMSFKNFDFDYKNTSRGMVVWERWKTCFFFFPIFPCYSQSGNQSQEDLARSGYKTNKEQKIVKWRLS
jgi:hypothetical protein